MNWILDEKYDISNHEKTLRKNGTNSLRFRKIRVAWFLPYNHILWKPKVYTFGVFQRWMLEKSEWSKLHINDIFIWRAHHVYHLLEELYYFSNNPPSSHSHSRYDTIPRKNNIVHSLRTLFLWIFWFLSFSWFFNHQIRRSK